MTADSKQAPKPAEQPKAPRKRSTLSSVVERNIRKMGRLRVKEERERTLEERISNIVTNFSGRMVFVYIHILWFGTWFLLNTGRLGIQPFDPFPYGLLTMIVSLEAIFLSTFVLISQNQLSQDSERRAELDMHINLLTEHELTRVLQMLDAIEEKLGIENSEDSDLADLEMETRPEDVLAEIDRLQQKLKSSQGTHDT